MISSSSGVTSKDGLKPLNGLLNFIFLDPKNSTVTFKIAFSVLFLKKIYPKPLPSLNVE